MRHEKSTSDAASTIPSIRSAAARSDNPSIRHKGAPGAERRGVRDGGAYDGAAPVRERLRQGLQPRLLALLAALPDPLGHEDRQSRWIRVSIASPAR